jgi:hypothetical protein
MIKNWTKFNESLETGICTCKVAPMGNDGLEGFIENDEYKYEYIFIKNKGYYRIYLEEDYYETCGPNIFKRYFTIKQTLK